VASKDNDEGELKISGIFFKLTDNSAHHVSVELIKTEIVIEMDLLQHVVPKAGTNSTTCIFRPNITRKAICYFYHESVNTMLVQRLL